MIKMEFYKFFSPYIKYGWNNLLSKKQKKDFKQSKRLLWKYQIIIRRERAKLKYRELSEEEKNKKGEYGKKDIITCLKKI